MHLVKRLSAVVLTLCLGASLVGCGFHLRGSLPATPSAVSYTKLSLDLSSKGEALGRPLTQYLTALGTQVSNANGAYILRVTEYTPRRQLLSGKLTEVLLRLTVTFQIEDRQGNIILPARTLTASRSYQYNIATVNTENQEESYLSNLLVEDIAQQMSRQVYVGRLHQATGNK